MQKLRVQQRGKALFVEHHVGLVVLKQGEVVVENCKAGLGNLLGGAWHEGQSGVLEVYAEKLLEAVLRDGC